MAGKMLSVEFEARTLDLSDSEVLGYEKYAGDLVVHICLWDESYCDVILDRVLAVADCMIGQLDHVVVDDDPSDPISLEAAHELHGGHEANAALRELQFLDPDGRVAMRVVCEAAATISARRP